VGDKRLGEVHRTSPQPPLVLTCKADCNMARWNPIHFVGNALVVACLFVSTDALLPQRKVDCSQFQQFFAIDQLHMSFTSLLDNNVGPNGYLHVKFVYAGYAWVGLGVSQTVSGKMVPGFAVI
jgi:hypothetical protein